MRTFAVAAGLSFALMVAFAQITTANPNEATVGHTFKASGSQFELDGKPFLIRGGDMHYSRVPRDYWRARMKLLRAMGLNTLTTYVFWNLHEPEPGKFDFSGQLDIAAFIRTAHEEGLFVVLRPGPYVCSEWDFGGLPWWILREPDIAVRTRDPKFLSYMERYLGKVAEQVKGLMIHRGGPIIMTQVENEYGSFGRDKAYMAAVRAMMEKAGFDGQLFTSDNVLDRNDPTASLAAGSFSDLPLTLNFGQDEDANEAFGILDKYRPDGIRMNAEYWFGWYDHVGDKHSNRPMQKGLDNFKWMLDRGYNVSFYMAHGGTNFGFMNGANIDHGVYWADTTSYDYDAPINEAGHPTAKFYAVRELIKTHLPEGESIPSVPETPKLTQIPAFQFMEQAPLWQLLKNPVHATSIMSMEDVNQGYGFILYRHKVKTNYKGKLQVLDVRDYAWIHHSGELKGTLDRHLKQDDLDVDLKSGSDLDILVENQGRVNYGPDMTFERKGITKEVRTSQGTLSDWDIYPLPLTDLSGLRFSPVTDKSDSKQPTFYRAELNLNEVADTYLDTQSWGKGVVFVNGHNLGRYWHIGPQQALFCPGVWLKKGRNEIIVLELEKAPEAMTMQGLDHAVFDID
ncbi:MAG: beta-galactosidase [Deltaproteobacteria bacterium]|nr:beta-galactosidase [Deltaproteobacteria bacterium]